MNYDIEMLRKNMLHSQYEAAQAIRSLCHEYGMSLAMTIAVAYKAGYSDGKKSGKTDISKVYRERDELRERINSLGAESTDESTNCYDNEEVEQEGTCLDSRTAGEVL